MKININIKKLRQIIAKLREQAHQSESPFWTKTPEEPDWNYVAIAFREIAADIESAIDFA